MGMIFPDPLLTTSNLNNCVDAAMVLESDESCFSGLMIDFRV